MKSEFRRRFVLAVTASLMAALWAFVIATPHRLGQSSWLDRLEATLVDLRFTSFGPIPTSDHVMIVAIDDATLREANPLGPGRDTLAAVIERVAEAGAAVVAVDILLTESGEIDADRALADALGRVPSVIAVAGSEIGPTSRMGFPETAEELWPLPQFLDRSTTGLVNIAIGDFGGPIHIPLIFLTSRGVQPAFAAQIAAL